MYGENLKLQQLTVNTFINISFIIIRFYLGHLYFLDLLKSNLRR